MNTQQGKVWGTTQELFACDNVEVHRIEVRAGGYCSSHYHAHKHNLFYVESGTLDITVTQHDGTADKTRLSEGEMCEVPPMLVHQFEAIRETVALEIYYVEPLEISEDIVRRSAGGIRNTTPD